MKWLIPILLALAACLPAEARVRQITLDPVQSVMCISDTVTSDACTLHVAVPAPRKIEYFGLSAVFDPVDTTNAAQWAATLLPYPSQIVSGHIVDDDTLTLVKRTVTVNFDTLSLGSQPLPLWWRSASGGTSNDTISVPGTAASFWLQYADADGAWSTMPSSGYWKIIHGMCASGDTFVITLCIHYQTRR